MDINVTDRTVEALIVSESDTMGYPRVFALEFDEPFPPETEGKRRAIPMTGPFTVQVWDAISDDPTGDSSAAVLGAAHAFLGWGPGEWHAENSHVYFRVPQVLGRRAHRAAAPAALRAARDALAADIVAAETNPARRAEVAAAMAAARRARRPKRDAVFRAYGLRDPAPPPSVWRDYEAYRTPAGTHSPNCLINELVQRYGCEGTAAWRVSPAKIAKFFAGRADLARLVEFAGKYHTPLRVYDALGGEIASTSPEGKCIRRGLAIVAYQEHAYIYTGGSVRNSRPSLRDGCRPPGLLNGPHVAHCEAEAEAYAAFASRGRQSFSWEAEAGVSPVALMWSLGPEALREAIAAEEASAVDLNKAYYTTLEQNQDYQAPIFTPLNEIEPFRPPLAACGYYYVSAACYAGWGGRVRGLLCGRLNNLLLGCEAELLLKLGHLRPEEITHQRLPQYTRPLKDLYDFLQATAEEAGVDGRRRYPLYNGVLGIERRHEVVRQYELADADASLVMATRDRAEWVENLGGGYTVSVPGGSREFLYLNSRTTYGAIVALTNCRIIRAAEALGYEGLCATKVDSLTYARRVDLPEGFKYEPPHTHAAVFRRNYLDPVVIAAACRTEAAAWAAHHVGYRGPPGTGKTTLVLGKHRGGYAFGMSLTNQAARQMQPTPADAPSQTIHKALRLFKPEDLDGIQRELAGRTVWVDEMSMIPPWMWSVLVSVGMRTAFILTGDPHQCGPIAATAGGRLVADRVDWTGPFLAQLLARLEPLTVDHRNDVGLVALRDSLLAAKDPHKWLRETMAAEESLARQGQLEEGEAPAALIPAVLACNYHLCYGNKYRHALNAALLKHRGLVFDPAGRRASAGLWLRARVTRKALGFVKHERFTLLADVDDKTTEVELLRGAPAAETGEITISADHLECFEPAYAGTVYSAQGSTIPERCYIHQANLLAGAANEDTREILYTAITRMKKREHVKFIVTFGGLVDAAAPPPLAEEGGDGEAQDAGLVPFR